jgi:hypothetical protein
LAGCIPVFFHPGSAYTQYTWHLPKNYTKYSVFIPEDDIRKRNMSIEEILGQIPPEQVRIMREEVIGLIPRLAYADPRSKLETLKRRIHCCCTSSNYKVTRLRKDIIEDCIDKTSLRTVGSMLCWMGENMRLVLMNGILSSENQKMTVVESPLIHLLKLQKILGRMGKEIHCRRVGKDYITGCSEV